MSSIMDPEGSFTQSTYLPGDHPLLQATLSSLFIVKLLNVCSKNGKLKAASAQRDYVPLPSTPSPVGEESHDYRIDIQEDDDEKVRAAVAGANAVEDDVKSPMLDPLLKPSVTSQVHEGPPRPVTGRAEDGVGSAESTAPVDPSCEEGNGEIHDDGAAIRPARDDEERLSREFIRLMVKSKRPSFLMRWGGAGEVASVFKTNLETGISSQDLRPTNPPAPTPVRTVRYFCFLLEACNSYTIALLVIAAILSFLTDSIGHGFKHGWYDGTAIVTAIVLLVVVPSTAKFYRAKKREKELMRTTNSRVKVTRSGKDQFVEISGVKPGDLVKLERGSIVPADGLFVNRNDLELDGVPPRETNRDSESFPYMGSRVTSGTGTMLVTSIADTDALPDMELSAHNPTRPSPFEDHVSKPHKYVEVLPLLLSLFVLSQALVQALHHKLGVKGEMPELKGDVSVKQIMKLFTEMLLLRRGPIPVLTSSLVLMVFSLQHGVLLTISLTLVNWSLDVVPAKINSFWACMTMGCTTRLIVDTTSGRFCDQVEVTEVWIGEEKITRDSEIHGSVLDSLYQAIVVSGTVPEISAIPWNRVLVNWANSTWGLNGKCGNKSYTILRFKQLRQERKARGTLMIENKERIRYLHWKGAASLILEMCSQYINQAGVRCFFVEERKDTFVQVIKSMKERGLVPIAFASREMDVEEITENGLTLLAIVGVKLVIHSDTKMEVTKLRDKGIRVALVSEEEQSILRSMACELGIREVPRSGEDEATEIQEKIFLKPKERHHSISELKKEGEVVAFLGGSTDDISTMKEADLGITDIYKGTHFAKENADVVLNEGIASVVLIVENGRRVYSIIQVFTQLQLCTWISWFILTFVLTVCSGESAATPLQQIWLSAITCFLGGLMMRMKLRIAESNDSDPQIPNPRTEAFIKKDKWKEIAIQVSCQLLVFLTFQFGGQHILRVSNREHETIMFTSFILCQVLDRVEATKTGTMKELAEALCRHYWFLLSVVATVVLQVIIVQIGRSLAEGLPLSWTQWMLSCGVAILPLVLRRAGPFLLSAMSHGYLSSLTSNPGFFTFVVSFSSTILLVYATQIVLPIGVQAFC